MKNSILETCFYIILFSWFSCTTLYASNISGLWNMIANGYSAILLIDSDGMSGDYVFTSSWDCISGNMENLIITNTTISWDRVCSDSSKNQHYEGQISDSGCSIINGTFTFKGRDYSWSASKDSCFELNKNLGALCEPNHCCQ